MGTNVPATAAQGFHQATDPSQAIGSGTPIGVVLALTQSAVTITPNGATRDVAADTATNAGGATITLVTNPTATTGPTFELKVPSLGIDQNVIAEAPTDTKITSGPDAGKYLSIVNTSDQFGTTYTGLGVWTVKDASDQDIVNQGYWTDAFQTPPSAMPTTGTATYSAVGGVAGTAFIQGSSSNGATLIGDTNMTANFGTGAVSGTMTNMTATDSATKATLPWNNLSITGAISGADLAGSTAITSSPSNATSLTATTQAGTFAGHFYGTAAQEVGVVWSVQDSNKSVAFGAFGGVKH